jgi:hypothetical protein
MARLLRRFAFPRMGFVVTALAFGVCTLMGTTGATAGPAFSTTTLFPFDGTNDCVVPAENFTGTGNLHFLINSNLSNSGTAQYHLEVSLSGVQAVTITGQKYVVVDQEDHTIVFDTADLAPFHETLEFTLQFVRAGESGVPLTTGDDFYEHFLAHATVNANGIVTVEDLKNDTHCK